MSGGYGASGRQFQCGASGRQLQPVRCLVSHILGIHAVLKLKLSGNLKLKVLVIMHAGDSPSFCAWIASAPLRQRVLYDKNASVKRRLDSKGKDRKERHRIFSQMNNAEVRQRLALEHGVDLKEIDTEYHSEPRFLGMARLQPKAMHSPLIELDAKAKLQKEYWLLEGVPSDALCRLQVVKIVALPPDHSFYVKDHGMRRVGLHVYFSAVQHASQVLMMHALRS